MSSYFNFTATSLVLGNVPPIEIGLMYLPKSWMGDPPGSDGPLSIQRQTLKLLYFIANVTIAIHERTFCKDILLRGESFIFLTARFATRLI